MRQFDVYLNPSAETRIVAPYLAVLSSHHLYNLEEVIVAPLVSDALVRLGDLEIAVEVDGRTLTLVVSELFSVSKARLRKVVANLGAEEDAIRRALDRLFTGF